MEVHISIAAEELFKIGPVSVTNSMLTMVIVMALLLIVGNYVARTAKLQPGRFQTAVEMLLESLLGMTEGAGGRSLGRRVFPLVSGLFIFILFANYTGLLPGIGTVGIEREVPIPAIEQDSGQPAETEATPGAGEALTYTVASAGNAANQQVLTSTSEESEVELVPFLRPPTADINMTLAMALVAFVAVQYYGISAYGVKGRIKHMADPPFLFPIEVISELSRIISLSARLFGNVFAGEALLGVMYAIGAKIGIIVIPVLVPVIFLFLELLFGTIQAMVFAILTLIYIAVAAAHSPEEEEEHHAAPSSEPVASSAGVGD